MSLKIRKKGAHARLLVAAALSSSIVGACAADFDDSQGTPDEASDAPLDMAAIQAVTDPAFANMAYNGKAAANLKKDPELVPDDSAAALEPKSSWQKTKQSNAEIFGWATNEWDISMKPVSSHVCFLTRVSGNLGGPSAVVVHHSSVDVAQMVISYGTQGSGPTVVNDNGTTWKIGGFQSAANSLSGEATCVPLSDFKVEPGMVKWVSGFAYAGAQTSLVSCSKGATAKMWGYDSVSFLTGVEGQFEGGGEVVKVTSGDWTDPWWYLHFHTVQCEDSVEGSARSLFVGFPASSATPSSVLRTNFSVSTSGTRSQKMIKTREGVCYLTSVSGNFDGAPERVRIYPQVDASGTEYWWAEATKGDGSAYASIGCVYYDQHRIPVY